MRFESRAFIHNLEGRKTHTWCSSKLVRGGHHEGANYFALGCTSDLPLPKYCRMVCIDICKLTWCSVGSVAFLSFVWSRNGKEAKGISRTLFTNHCGWADILNVLSRCFSSNKVCYRANRVLDNLLWNWSKMQRLYVVYQEGNDGIIGSDLVPPWLTRECVHRDFCQCHLVSVRHPDWHYPGSLHSNVVSRRHQLFERSCGCSQVPWPFPVGCNESTKNAEIATKLFRVVMDVLVDVPPAVPQRGAPLVSVLRTRVLKPKWERERRKILNKRRTRRVRDGGGSGSDEEESSVE